MDGGVTVVGVVADANFLFSALLNRSLGFIWEWDLVRIELLDRP